MAGHSAAGKDGKQPKTSGTGPGRDLVVDAAPRDGVTFLMTGRHSGTEEEGRMDGQNRTGTLRRFARLEAQRL